MVWGLKVCETIVRTCGILNSRSAMSIARLQLSKPKQWSLLGVAADVLEAERVSCQESIAGKYVNIVRCPSGQEILFRERQEVVWTESGDGFTRNHLLTSSAKKTWLKFRRETNWKKTIFRTKSLPVWEESGPTVVKEGGKCDPGIPVWREVSDLAVG